MAGLIPNLSRRAWTIVGADALSALGNGLITPFLVIYLRDARGFPIEQAALIISTEAFAGLFAAPMTGWLIDRLGARRVLMVALSLGAVSALLATQIDEVWEGFAWALVFGISIAAMWPSALSLMAMVVEPHQRTAVYSVHFALLNAGIGVGAMLGGALVDAHEPSSFTLVFVLDALTFVVYALVLRFLVPPAAKRTRQEAAELGRDGWRRLARDRAFMRVILLSVVLITIGYAQFGSSLPAFATKEGGISTRSLGIVFAVNTTLIVAAQLFVLRGLTGRRRSGAMSMVGLLWAACWVITLAAGSSGGGLPAVLLFCLASATFATGETFMQAALPALINDLAPDDIRGRYNAANSLTWAVGNMAGPALGGFMLGSDNATELFVLLAGACLLASLYSVRLGRFIPPEMNRFESRSEPAPA